MMQAKKTLSTLGVLKALSLLAVVGMLLAVPPAHAQNVASQKAYFGSGETEILNPSGGVVLSGYMKTSSVGDLLIGYSMECALWTSTSTTTTKGGTKTTSTARAAVNVTVYVDGAQAEPGQVVYCDRQQTVSLQFSSLTVEVTDAITLDLFLKTKNANHFNFYRSNVGSGVHYVEVKVDSIVSSDPNAPADPGTRAVAGKRSLVIEEYNNP